MKTIGLIGGMSWESTAQYYRLINEGVRARLGEHSARILLWSFDFAEIARLQRAQAWDEATALMVDAARRLERGGADMLAICTNTMHRMADEVAAAVAIPLLHIADPLGERMRGLTRAGLLGTAFTMESDFYPRRLRERFGIELLVPDADARAIVHRVIYEELIMGVVRPESRAAYREIIAGLAERGAEAVVLGCTELMLLVGPDDSPVPVFDTTTLHAEAAVQLALADRSGKRAPL